VLVPCEDGGYALIRPRAPTGDSFEDIAWAEKPSWRKPAGASPALGWQWRELETLWDVDRPEDYERLVAERLLIWWGSGSGGLGVGREF
jgi:glycosyltransferase A (GT-A) superfamily protein (DUF2064 family)